MMWYRGQKNYPPGPRRVPLLGSIPFMTMKNGILDFLLDSSVTRNRISTIAVGPFFKLHIINDYELAKVNLILLMYTSVFDIIYNLHISGLVWKRAIFWKTNKQIS